MARWPMALLTVAAVTLFVALGRWQWQRGEYRTDQWRTFTSADQSPRDVRADELATLPRYSRVRLHGTFDAAHQFLLDNITEGGRAGYYVLTPFRLTDGAHVLVNRGYVPGTGYRDRLPEAPLAVSEQLRSIVGRTGALPVAGIEAGRVPPPASGPWPRVASFPNADDLATALPLPLVPGLVLLEEDPLETAAEAPVRRWQPPGLEPARHYSYAVQWWAFAALAVILFVVLNFRRKRP